VAVRQANVFLIRGDGLPGANRGLGGENGGVEGVVGGRLGTWSSVWDWEMEGTKGVTGQLSAQSTWSVHIKFLSFELLSKTSLSS